MFKYIDSICKLEALGFVFDTITGVWYYEDKAAGGGIAINFGFETTSFATIVGAIEETESGALVSLASPKATKLFCDMVQQDLIAWVDE